MDFSVAKRRSRGLLLVVLGRCVARAGQYDDQLPLLRLFLPGGYAIAASRDID